MKPEQEKEAENIRVAVRCRPMNEREIREQAVSCFTAENGNAVLTNLENPSEKYEFGYDFVYGCDTPQPQVFEDIGIPILDRAFNGYNGTIFAYGQTGSGKTFSMSGISGNDTLEGLIPRMNKAIFERIAKEKTDNPQKQFLVECSFFEIYNEIIYDLLDTSSKHRHNGGSGGMKGNNSGGSSGLEIKEHAVLGIYVKDLQERVVETKEEVIELMAQGASARTVGATQMNAESSRSHSIFIIKIHQKDLEDESKNIFAKINLVDLAGSERASSTGAQGDRLKEGANINKSLSALGNVINALVEVSRTGKKNFIPYRNSKLTRVLQESLGGNSLCSMLATLSPANINFHETLSTLKYASRAKSIKVNAKKNESSSQISQLNEEIALLKQKLIEQQQQQQQQQNTTIGGGFFDPKEKEEIILKYEKQIQEMDQIRLQTWEDKAKLSKQHEIERKRLAKEKLFADKKIEEEKNKKWKLLQEKKDIELMIRAVKDLCFEWDWIQQAHLFKQIEIETKDKRMLLHVFKDSLDKDVDQLRTRSLLDENQLAMAHLSVTQFCNKLENIQQETQVLIQMETKLIEQVNGFINLILEEIVQFKETSSQQQYGQSALVAAVAVGTAGEREAKGQVSHINTTTGPSTTNLIGLVITKEQEQLKQEREKALAITLCMVQAYRNEMVQSVRSERKKLFGFQQAIQQVIVEMNQLSTTNNSGEMSPSKYKNQWQTLQSQLEKSLETFEMTFETSATLLTPGWTQSGESHALGLESYGLGDDKIQVSSNQKLSKAIRLNQKGSEGAGLWIPEEKDETPFVQLDFDLPRFFQGLSIRGGLARLKDVSKGIERNNLVTYTPLPSFDPAVVEPAVLDQSPHDQQDTVTEVKEALAVEPQQQPELPFPETLIAGPSPTSTFPLKSAEEFVSILKSIQMDTINGEHQQTYDLLGHVLSWEELLKTTALPQKLFARPPVRFLHDIVTMVHRNTGFPRSLFTQADMDYTNLPNKPERAEFLNKLISHVRQSLLKSHPNVSTLIPEDPNVLSGNILAGKEPVETMTFMGLYAYTVVDLLSTRLSSPIQVTVPAVPEVPASSPPKSPARASLLVLSNQEPVVDCFVKKIKVSTSLDTKNWTLIGEFDANVDSQEIVQLNFGTTFFGRLLKIEFISWETCPCVQLEVFGFNAKENTQIIQVVNEQGLSLQNLLTSLLKASNLVLQEANYQVEQVKQNQRQKHEQLTQLTQEIQLLKQDKNLLEQTNVQQMTKLDDEKSKFTKLQQEFQKITHLHQDMKTTQNQLECLLQQKNFEMDQVLVEKKQYQLTIESLENSKKELQKMMEENSTNQVQQSDFMTKTIECDELKRQLLLIQQKQREQEEICEKLHVQLQQNKTKQQEEFETKLQMIQIAWEEDKNDLLQKQVQEEENLQKKIESLQEQLNHHQQQQQQQNSRNNSETISTPTTSDSSSSSSSSLSQELLIVSATIAKQEKLLLEAQTKELRYQAEVDRLEQRLVHFDGRLKELEQNGHLLQAQIQVLINEKNQAIENEEELNLQIQVLTEERDAARQKEEQLFLENSEKEQEIERIRDGYVWVTDRMNSKEDELAELQEQLEKYQSLFKMTSTGSNTSSSIPSPKKDEQEVLKILKKLYALAFNEELQGNQSSRDYATLLTQWIINSKKTTSVLTPTKPPTLSSVGPGPGVIDKKEEKEETQYEDEEQQYDDDFDATDDYTEENNNNNRRIRKKISVS